MPKRSEETPPSPMSARGRRARALKPELGAPQSTLQLLMPFGPEVVTPKLEGIDKLLPGLFGGLGDKVAKLPKGITLSVLGDALETDGPGPTEPVFTAKQRGAIQGNSVPGFNKDHQHFLFLRFGPVAKAKAFLRWVAPLVTSMEEVVAFVRVHRALRKRLGVTEPPMCATWLNIAFSAPGIAKLVGAADAEAFGDESFRQGLAARSGYLGDPTDRSHPGHPRQWCVGGPKREAHAVIIIAADEVHHLETLVDAVRREALAQGHELLFEQRGDALPGALRGHEHFGFKDGISQPGVRGKLSSALGDYLTPRYIDAADARARYMAKPGQMLVWPGEFLLGLARQRTEDHIDAGPADTRFPKWAALGSYLVVRRLRQDVPAFWRFASATARALGLDPTHFASMLVGRWPSGAPLLRSPAADNAVLAGDEWANNHFLFHDDTRAAPLRPIPGYTGDAHAAAAADMLGRVCPHFAHIRKMNTRDMATDLGKPADMFMRFLLRRGIPFGPALAGVAKPDRKLVGQERGLMFLSYGATIEQQFEFLSRRWANNPVQPNFGGHDPVIGQHDQYGSRDRHIDVPLPAGGTKRVTITADWVLPTGGGYFFAPPIPAIANVLGA